MLLETLKHAPDTASHQKAHPLPASLDAQVAGTQMAELQYSSALAPAPDLQAKHTGSLEHAVRFLHDKLLTVLGFALRKSSHASVECPVGESVAH